MTDDRDLPLVTSLQYTLFLPLSSLLSSPDLMSSLRLSSHFFSLSLISHPFISPFVHLPFSLSSFSGSFLLSISILPISRSLHITLSIPSLLSLSYYRLISWKCSFP